MVTLNPSEFAARTQNPIQFWPPPHTQKRSQSIITHNSINFGPHKVDVDLPHEKHVTFDPNHKTKSNSIPHTKIQVDFDATAEMMSIRYTPWKKFIIDASTQRQANFIPHTRIKYFSAPAQKRSHLWSVHRIKVNFDSTTKSSQFLCRDNKTKLFSIPFTEYISTPHWNQVCFDSNTKIKSISIPYINQVKFDPNTATKWFSTPTQKQS